MKIRYRPFRDGDEVAQLLSEINIYKLVAILCMQERIQKYVQSSKSKELIATVAGLLGILAFDAVMYIDIAITGIPLDVPKVLGGLLVGQNGPIDLVA